MFMPLIYSLAMSTACGTAALAMQASRRWWAASVAAIFIVISPQATYGIIVQLMPQVWGLGIATALCAFLMRRELHSAGGDRSATLCRSRFSLLHSYWCMSSSRRLSHSRTCFTLRS